MSSDRLEGEVDLGDGCWLRHLPSWLPPDEADAAFARLRASLDWEQRAIVLFGRRVLQPRLIAWAGDLPYRYSGQTLPPRAAPEALAALTKRVESTCGETFNHVLANLYRDGRDSMGMHADDEPELGGSPTIASVSLGATRRFVFVPRDRRRERESVHLGHGALLVMGGRFQHVFFHGLPKQAGVTAHPEVGTARMNLTFRQLLRAPVGA